MPTYSKHGKLLGRPPKAVAMLDGNPRFGGGVSDTQAVAVGRATLHAMARYDAAGRGKAVAGWVAPSTGPNDSLANLQTVRDRARDASRNDWSGESPLQKWATTLVGIGITPRFRRVKSAKRKLEITDLWNDFVQRADADCAMNMYGLQTLGTRSWMDSGEVFARRRWRYLDEGLPVPMQIQMLESDMVPLFSASTYEGLPVSNYIADGIEFNKRGRIIAYWVYKQHPGDSDALSAGTVPDPGALVRVAASDMLHVFEPRRPGQRRGVPTGASVLTRIRKVGDYEDTTLTRQQLANLWVGFITRTLPPIQPDGLDGDALSGLARIADTEGNGLLPLRAGLLQELEDGQDFKFANPPEAGTSYSDYIRTQHLGTSAGHGMPYELFSGDIANVSDRTLRVLMNEFRRFAEQRQWQILIPQFCQRVIEWFAEAALFQGFITAEEVDDVRRVEHAPHGWAYIHPVQDPQGKKIEIDAGLRSRSSVIGEKGDDPDTVDLERAADDAREQKLKLGPYSDRMKVLGVDPANVAK